MSNHKYNIRESTHLTREQKKTKENKKGSLMVILFVLLLLMVAIKIKNIVINERNDWENNIVKAEKYTRKNINFNKQDLKNQYKMISLYEDENYKIMWNLESLTSSFKGFNLLKNEEVLLWLEFDKSGKILKYEVLTGGMNLFSKDKIVSFFEELKMTTTYRNQKINTTGTLNLKYVKRKSVIIPKFTLRNEKPRSNKVIEKVEVIKKNKVIENKVEKQKISYSKEVYSRITGISLGKRSSILMSDGVTIRQSDVINGFTIKEIQNDRIIVRSEKEERVLREGDSFPRR